MENFQAFTRKALQTLAPVASAFIIFGCAAGNQRAHAAPAQAQTAALNHVAGNSVFRPFGMVNGVSPADALAKDANGNYTNPDAITAYTALTLYVVGGMRYAIHPYSDLDKDQWDFPNRFVGIDNPGKLTEQFWVDDHGNLSQPSPVYDHGNLVAESGGKLTSLVDMYRQGDDHTKAIIIAVVESAHDQVSDAMHYDVSMYISGGTSPGTFMWSALADTTDAKLTAITAGIASAGVNTDNGRNPAPTNQSVMDYVQGSADIILSTSRPVGSVTAMYRRLFKGPQPDNKIQLRTIVASLVGIPYPPSAGQVASIPDPQP